jgi:hypothetical protein
MSTFDFGAIRPITHEVTEVYIEQMVKERGLPYKHYYKTKKGKLLTNQIQASSWSVYDLDDAIAGMLNFDYLGPSQRKLWQEYFLLFLRRDVEKNIGILLKAGLKICMGCSWECDGSCKISEKTLKAATTLLEISAKYAVYEEIIASPTQPRMLNTLPTWLVENTKGLEYVDLVSLREIVTDFHKCGEEDLPLFRERAHETFTSEEDGIPIA